MNRTDRRFNTNLYSFESAVRVESVLEIGVGERSSDKGKRPQKAVWYLFFDRGSENDHAMIS
jgi:hypothetical protein